MIIWITWRLGLVQRRWLITTMCFWKQFWLAKGTGFWQRGGSSKWRYCKGDGSVYTIFIETIWYASLDMVWNGNFLLLAHIIWIARPLSNQSATQSSIEINDSQEVVILNPKTKMFNIFLLGLCFCFVFTGFNTLSQTQVGPAKNMNWTSFKLTSKIEASTFLSADSCKLRASCKE